MATTSRAGGCGLTVIRPRHAANRLRWPWTVMVAMDSRAGRRLSQWALTAADDHSGCGLSWRRRIATGPVDCRGATDCRGGCELPWTMVGRGRLTSTRKEVSAIERAASDCTRSVVTTVERRCLSIGDQSTVREGERWKVAGRSSSGRRI